MIYKIVLSNKDDIRVNTDEELSMIMESIARGDKLIVAKKGIFNPSYLVSIMPDYAEYRAEFDYLDEEQVEKKTQ